MKKLIGLLCILFILTLLVPPKQVEARGGGGFIPGLVVGGVLGWSLAPRYYSPPVYYYPPSGPYGYYGNPNSYNQGHHSDGQMMYGNNRGPEAYPEGAQGHRNH